MVSFGSSIATDLEVMAQGQFVAEGKALLNKGEAVLTGHSPRNLLDNGSGKSPSIAPGSNLIPCGAS